MRRLNRILFPLFAGVVLAFALFPGLVADLFGVDEAPPAPTGKGERVLWVEVPGVT